MFLFSPAPGAPISVLRGRRNYYIYPAPLASWIPYSLPLASSMANCIAAPIPARDPKGCS